MKKIRPCALCNRPIEGEAVDFNGLTVCGAHTDEIGTHTWDAIGHYRSDIVGRHRKNLLRSEGVRSLLLRTEDPQGYRLFVLNFEKVKAFQVLSSLRKDVVQCTKCLTEFSIGEVCCPECGLKPSARPSRDSS